MNSLPASTTPEPPQKPEAPKSLKDLITDDDTVKALQVLRDIRDDSDAPRSLRLQASDSLLDRKHGKARQMVEQEVKVVTYQDFLQRVREKEQKLLEVIDATAAVIEAPKVLDWSDVL